jgi:hypothetical protein
VAPARKVSVAIEALAHDGPKLSALSPAESAPIAMQGPARIGTRSVVVGAAVMEMNGAPGAGPLPCVGLFARAVESS